MNPYPISAPGHSLTRALFASLMMFSALFASAIRTEIDGINYDLDEVNHTATVIKNSTEYLADVVIPAYTSYNDQEYTVTKIGNEAFIGCAGLTSVSIPTSVTEIGAGAFTYCSSLTSIIIPESVTKIDMYTFEGCSSLQSVTLPNTIIEIGRRAFRDCSGLTAISFSNTLTLIASNSFSDCSSLKSLTIPSSVTTIGSPAFDGCTSLEEINVDSENEYFCSLNGVLFNKAMTVLSCFPAGKECVDYIIPGSVSEIGSFAFSGCVGLNSVSIPNSVTLLNNCAFLNCTGLSSISIPESVTSIGNNAFQSCENMISVEIPGSVTEMDRYAFSGCRGLTSVYYNAEEPIETLYPIFDNDTYNNAKLYVPTVAVEKCKEIDPWKNFLNIQAYDFNSGIDEASVDIDVNASYDVYSIQGVKVSDSIDNLAPGLYIVRQGNVVKKIAVK